MDKILSPHFNLREFLRSDYASRHGIDMTPPPAVVANLQALVTKVLEPLRVALGKPASISSGFRPAQLNRAIGGSQTSQHSYGEAADLNFVGYTPLQVCQHIIAERLPFDQLIYEFGEWTHVSYNNGGAQRGQVLSAKKRIVNGKSTTVYLQGLVP